MSAVIEVQLLGPVRASKDGVPVPLRGRTARTVLARLALADGAVVSNDGLAEALWADDAPLQPAVSLRSIISRLRAQLGRDAIVTDGDGYRIDTSSVQIDLAEIEAVISRVDGGTTEPDELVDALGRWVGDALTDVAWTPAFEPERARIQELRARLTDSYHAAMLQAGRAEQTLADLERDAAAAPLRESTQLLLMRALGACGRTAEGLRVGDEYRRRLIDHTGLSPSAEHEAATRALLDDHEGSGTSVDHDESEPGHEGEQGRPWIPPDTPFVGREAELDRLARLVTERRLVSIVGPGGVGKTRLVTECVNEHRDRWDGAVEMVALASLERGAAVDTAIAASLGAQDSSIDTLSALADRLAGGTSVLVIDNCEHVLSATRMLVEFLLRKVEGLRIVCTSRRRLGLPDEAIFDVDPLEVPLDDVGGSAPVRLFLDRIERAAPNLSVSDADIAVAADICRLLDGLPLALELAAARTAMFGFDGLRQRLLGGLAVPSSRVAVDDRRQATIESTVDWSLALLDPDVRDLFDDLSIFPSWFTLEALEQVSDHHDVVGGLAEIHDSSLIVVDSSRPAYRLLVPVRQVVRKQVAKERADRIIDRYLAWVGSVVDDIDQRWVSDDRGAAQQLIIDHRADLRSSLNLLIDHGDADRHGHVAAVLARCLVDRADVELINLCRVEVGVSLEGELARCMLAWHQGDVEVAAALADDIAGHIDVDHELWPYFHWARTPIYLYLGDPEALAAAASLAAVDARAYPSMRSEAVALWALGLLYDGRQSEALAVLEDHGAILDRSGSGGFVAYARAEVTSATDPDRAIEYLSVSSSEAAAAMATFTHRLTDVSQLVLHVATGRCRQAAVLARRLVPELIRAGTYPQAWTALRHVADLLGQVGRPEVGLLVLASADADERAPMITGDAVAAADELTARLIVDAENGDAHVDAPVPLRTLWGIVEPILRRVDGT